MVSVEYEMTRRMTTRVTLRNRWLTRCGTFSERILRTLADFDLETHEKLRYRKILRMRHTDTARTRLQDIKARLLGLE
jgi:hypothetical protein